MMKRFISLVCLATLVSFTSVGGEKGKLKWMTFEQGMAEAQKSKKKMMIDVYTDWCGWCKKMDKDTYANGVVTEYLNKRFVSIKLDAESKAALKYRGQPYTEQEIASAFGISGYPSIIFLEHDGEPITIYPGYADAAQFKLVLSYIAEGHYKTTKFQDYVQLRQ